MHGMLLTAALALFALPGPLSAQAQRSVAIGDREAFLHVPANARASAVPVPGKGGIDPDDPLLRNRATQKWWMASPAS